MGLFERVFRLAQFGRAGRPHLARDEMGLPLARQVNFGDWKVKATVEGSEAEHTIKVDRYSLPKFEVSLSTEQPFYHPGDTIRGYRWGDGGAYFSAISTAIPPNGASCFTAATASHWNDGVFSASSTHTGGVHALLADGSVRFISENIDAGNQATAFPTPGSGSASPYGTWGALGTRSGGEVIGEF